MTTTTPELVTAWRAKRTERLAAAKIADALEVEEKQLKGQLIALFQADSTGTVVEGRVTGLSIKEQPIVSDKDKLVGYIFEQKDISVLQFRLSTKAVEELIAGGVEVPGIEFIEQYDLYDRKV